MTERGIEVDGQILPRSRKRAGFVATGALSVISAVSAVSAMCGGESDNKPQDVSGVLSDQTVSQPIEVSAPDATFTSTAIVEPTVTPEPIPTLEEIASLIKRGFIGLSITYRQISEEQYHNPERIIQILNDCNTDETIVDIDGTVFTPDHPNYRSIVLSQCARVGQATQQLYLASNKQEFMDANRLMLRFNKAKFNEWRDKGTRIDDDYWSMNVKMYYTFPTSEPSK